MEPVVQQLGAAGYPVRMVNIDQERALAAKFHVSSIPCFVLIVDGHEVQRVVGQNDISTLVAMFRRAGYDPVGPGRRRRQEWRIAEFRGRDGRGRCWRSDVRAGAGGRRFDGRRRASDSRQRCDRPFFA